LYLSPVLGELELRSIRRSHVQAVIQHTAAIVTPRVTTQVLAQLRAILATAVADRLIPSNPADDKTLAMPTAERKPDFVLTPEQVATIASRIAPRYAAMVLVAARSGLRSGELRALTLDRCRGLAELLTDGKVVDLAARREDGAGLVTLVIDRQLDGDRKLALPKTPNSMREVTLDATTSRLLAEHVERFGLGVDGRVFSNLVGRLICSATASRAWTDAIAGMNLPPRTGWHSLRHHHASQLLAAGVNVAAVARRLGHGSPRVTLTVYSHALPSDEHRILAALEQAAG
jgi:integrase